MSRQEPDWRPGSEVFDQRAAEYDQWYEDSLLFEIELEAIKTIMPPNWRPALEIGVGPGRFASAMGTDFGLDPAHAPLRLARQKGVKVCRGQAEALPVKDNCLQGIALLFTLCFLADPALAVQECARILRPGGFLLLGHIPAQGPWGRHLEAKKQGGHPFYRSARFQSISQAQALLEASGLHLREGCTTLYQPPGQLKARELPRPGLDEEAGLALLLCRKD